MRLHFTQNKVMVLKHAKIFAVKINHLSKNWENMFSILSQDDKNHLTFVSTNQQLEFITTIKECKLILNMYIVLGTIPSKTGHLMQTIVNYIHIHIYSDYKVDELSFLLVYIIGLEYFLTENFSLLISNIQIYYRVIAPILRNIVPSSICYLEVNWLIPKLSACRARIWSLVASERSERVTSFIICRAGWYFSVSIIFTFRWRFYHP